MSRSTARTTTPLISIGLIVLSLFVFFRATQYEFVSFDDPEYVSRNPHVLNGINGADFVWALTTIHFGNWHPVVWWSFQLDSQLFGTTPFGFHLTNVLFHTASVVLLFLTLQRLGFNTALAAVVAAIFCVHPMNVESVVWVSERKGVLSTFFWILAMYAYAFHVRQPSWKRMVLVALCMLAGLMCKASLVTLPFALLLLDVWPLERKDTGTRLLGWGDAGVPAKRMAVWLILEKAPLFLLCIVFSAIAFFAQDQLGAVASLEEIPLSQRLMQIPCVYVLYLWKFLVPLHLSVAVIPPSQGVSLQLAVSAIALLAAITVIALVYRSRFPALLIGWCWFIGTLFPTSGIVPIGVQWMADRYLYIPMIGLALALVHVMAMLFARVAVSVSVRMSLAVLVMLVFAATSIFQARHWRDSIALFQRVVAVDQDNYVGHSNLAALYVANDQYDQAIQHAEQAVALGSSSIETNNNYALCLMKLGRTKEAKLEFEKVVQRDPSFAEAYLNLGNLQRRSDPGLAEAYYRRAIEVQPKYAEAHNNLGGLLATKEPDEAQKHYLISLELWPDNPDAHSNLGNLFARQGDLERAIKHYRKALKLEPNHRIATQNLAIVSKLKRESPRQ